MSTTGVENSTTNDVNAVDDDGQDLDFLASAFEEVATANETDLFASVDPSLVSFFLHAFFIILMCFSWEKYQFLRFWVTLRVEQNDRISALDEQKMKEMTCFDQFWYSKQLLFQWLFCNFISRFFRRIY